jgi:predicted Holliday junction resolvase-like endonuclease
MTTHDKRREEVIFVEVKSGAARLNHNEHTLKDAIINKRVRWHEYRVPTPVTHSDTATESAL